MKSASKPDITSFLTEFKRIAQKSFTFVYRKKNLDCIASLGITIDDAKNEIFKLTFLNYISGPSIDRDRAGSNVWVFGVVVNDHEIYIKLSDNFNGSVAKCISFHPADYDCIYPYRRS